MSTLFDEALKLPNAERRKLADDIYDSLQKPQDGFYLTPEQEAELARRLEDYEKNPGGNLSWEEVRDAALAR
ncbi:MAG: addiction module protein [Pyrinomonadaceae bacterium]|nr:addiction module protein [Pyrinomonadaceae bacterium]MBP6214108.1 addiction module protein [Pyrinomonadaceae bacterium]